MWEAAAATGSRTVLRAVQCNCSIEDDTVLYTCAPAGVMHTAAPQRALPERGGCRTPNSAHAPW